MAGVLRCAGRITRTTSCSAICAPIAGCRPITLYGSSAGVTDTAPAALSSKFATLYSAVGRPSIPPEKLLHALLLQAFYSVRSERQLMEQLNYNLLLRWFVGLSMDEPVWVPTVFSHNRDRLLAGDIAAAFFDAVLNLPEVACANQAPRAGAGELDVHIEGGCYNLIRLPKLLPTG